MKKIINFQGKALRDFVCLIEQNPEIMFGLRKHPQLRDKGWEIPYGMNSKKNFIDLTNKSMDDIMISENIFVGIIKSVACYSKV